MSSSDGKQLARPVADSDHQTGSDNAPVTLVEYGDFQCEDTGAAFPILKELRERMGADLRFVYRHFPLTHEHDFAQGAAEAAEAAADQGAFWPFHDLLFVNQDALTNTDLAAYAGQLGLDAGRVRKALDAGGFREKVQADKAGGEQSGVSGTPTLFINGRRYTGEITLDELLAAVHAATG